MRATTAWAWLSRYRLSEISFSSSISGGPSKGRPAAGTAAFAPVAAISAGDRSPRFRSSGGRSPPPAICRHRDGRHLRRSAARFACGGHAADDPLAAARASALAASGFGWLLLWRRSRLLRRWRRRSAALRWPRLLMLVQLALRLPLRLRLPCQYPVLTPRPTIWPILALRGRRAATSP